MQQIELSNNSVSTIADINNPINIGNVSIENGIDVNINNETKQSVQVNTSGYIVERDYTVPEYVKQITEEDITNWNEAHNKQHNHSNKSVLDSITAPYTTEEKNKLSMLSNYNDSDLVNQINDVNKELDNKVTKVDGKDLSSNDFTNVDKGKLERLNNYDDSEVRSDISTIYKSLDTKIELDDLPKSVSELTNDAGYLTEHQSLNGYATEDWVNDKNYLTEHQNISNLATKDEIPTIPENVSAFNNDVGYLTEHQSLEGYYNKDEVDTKIKTFHAELDASNFQFIEGSADFTYEDVLNTENCIIEVTFGNEKAILNKQEWKNIIPHEIAGRYVGFSTIVRLGTISAELFLFVYDSENLPTDEANVAMLETWGDSTYCVTAMQYLVLGNFLTKDITLDRSNDINAPSTKASGDYTDLKCGVIKDYADGQDNNIMNYMQDTFAKNIMALVEDKYGAHIVYESDGVYAGNKNPKSCDKYAFDVPITAEYKRLKFYIHTNTSDFGNRTTPAMIVEMILDGSFNTDEGMYLAGAQSSNPQDGNTEFLVLVAVDSDLSGFRFVATNSLYGTTRGGRNDNGRKLYKIEAYKN